MIVIEDCCFAMTEEEHANAVATLNRFAAFTTVQQLEFAEACDD